MEIQALIAAIGAGVDAEFDVAKIRYHKVILLADADVDGSHIRTLLLTFFFRQMKALVKNGHVYVAQPPLYSTLVGKEKVYLRDDAAKAAFLESTPTTSNDFQRLKGLGEMDFDELRDTTMDPTKRALLQITVEQAALADEVCSILMGDDVPQRRHFIQTERQRRSLPGHLGLHHGTQDATPAPRRPRRRARGRTATIEPIEINLEMERSFLEYSMSVIVSRALPDVRDGLKPVHRRILYSMFDQGLRPDRPHTKCAKVVGEVMGTFHPHGDRRSTTRWCAWRRTSRCATRSSAATATSAAPAPTRAPPRCATPSAAWRLSPSTSSTPSTRRPSTSSRTTTTRPSSPPSCPPRFPNLLVNGSQGIAVGMATKIPPHNLAEVIDATLHLLAHPEATPDDLMAFVKGPDFPTGAQILGRQGILDAYRTGRGIVKMRAVAEIEETAAACASWSPSSPTRSRVESVEEKIYDLVKTGDLDGIAEVQNDSAGRQARLVIRLKRDANANVVLNKLYKNTPLQTTFAVNMLALVDGVPRTLNLAQALTHYIAHQVEVVTRRTAVPPAQGRGARPHRRGAPQGHRHARRGHRHDPRLRRPPGRARRADGRALRVLRGAGQPHPRHDPRAPHPPRAPELEEEMAKLRETIAELAVDPGQRREAACGHRRARSRVVRDKYATARLTQIVNDPGELGVEDLVDDEDIVITMTQAGYVKSVAADAFRVQGRGGRGVQGAKLKDEDFVEQIVHTTTHALPPVVLQPGTGLPPARPRDPDEGAHREGHGDREPAEPAAQRVDPGDRRRPRTSRPTSSSSSPRPVARSRRPRFSEYDKSRREGWIAINLRDGDEVVRVIATTGDDDLFMVTLRGHDDPLQRDRGTRDGPRRHRGARHQAARATTARSPWTWCATTRTSSSSPTPASASG